jgi:hypothetical protein
MIHTGDSLTVMKTMADNSVDAVVTELDTLDPLVLLREVRDHLLESHPYSDDAPGHSHDQPGRWDADGSPCAWCTTWKRVQACLEQNASPHLRGCSEAEPS